MKDFKINNFDTIQDFVWYAEAHYLPLLDKLSEKESVLIECSDCACSFEEEEHEEDDE